MGDDVMEYAKPENHEAAVKLAHAMYEHITLSGLGGLPFADVAAAIAMVNGLFLSGAYASVSDQKKAATSMQNASLIYARRFKELQRINTKPMGSA